MPQIEPADATLKTLKGVHLWHAPMSSCSQRVRIALAESGIDFESHLVDLERGEHASEAYQKIHPKGVVPALVEDGVLTIESIDIIRQVAQDFDGLTEGVDPALLKRADDAQMDLKLLTFEFLFKAAVGKSDAEAQAIQSSHKNEWLKQFYRDFAEGFEADRLKQAVTRTREDFEFLNEVLSDGRAYLSGETYSLADVAWMPNLHRFSLMGWPFEALPHLARWFERVSQRRSYQTALVEWENPNAVHMFRAYTEKRQRAGTDIRSFLTT